MGFLEGSLIGSSLSPHALGPLLFFLQLLQHSSEGTNAVSSQDRMASESDVTNLPSQELLGALVPIPLTTESQHLNFGGNTFKPKNHLEEIHGHHCAQP